MTPTARPVSPTPFPSPRSDLDRICLESSATFPHHGLLLFAGQILLVLLIPILDREPRTMPVAYTIIGMATTLALMAMLGYRRIAAGFALLGTAAILWAASHELATAEARLPVMLMLAVAYCVSVYIGVYHALFAPLLPAQRILSGAASFVMIGFLFAILHGFLGAFQFGKYILPGDIEGPRLPRWTDFIWLSFSTLTTAGFGDMVPVGPWPCAVATLEGLCGILYPATLIARIASLPAGGSTQR